MERSGWPGSSGNAARSVELEPPGEGLYLGWAGRREGIPGRCTEARIGRSCERGRKETSWCGEPQKGELVGRGPQRAGAEAWKAQGSAQGPGTLARELQGTFCFSS